MPILFSIILKVLICYVIASFVFSFYFLVIDYKEFNKQFKKSDRKAGRLIIITMGPLIIIAAIVLWIVTPILKKTIWKAKVRASVEDDIKTSLPEILKNYNKYFEKN